MLQDDTLLHKDNPQATLKTNAVHGSESSCTDNNGPARSGAVSNSSGERASPPVLPSFADMLPPPPQYPPPYSTVAIMATVAKPVAAYPQGSAPTHMGTVPRTSPQCSTCLRGQHRGTTGDQPMPHYMPDHQARTYNPTMPHMHSFTNSPFNGNADYQLTYPSIPRVDCKHSCEPYNVCTPHGHSSDSHDYAEPQFDCLTDSQNIYDGVPPFLRHNVQPSAPLLARQQFSDHGASSHRSKLVHQNSVPAHLQQGAVSAAALTSRHHSVPSSEHSHELCPSCAEQTEYEEPWSDQLWPMMFDPNHAHHGHMSHKHEKAGV